MAIHVKELVVKANVGGTAQIEQVAGFPPSPISQEALVKAAVAEMMRVLKDKKNR